MGPGQPGLNQGASVLPQWHSLGSGGAACIVASAPVSLANTNLQGNCAVNGGGLFFVVPGAGSVQGRLPLLHLGSAALIQGNGAEGGAGSAVYVSAEVSVQKGPCLRVWSFPTTPTGSCGKTGKHNPWLPLWTRPRTPKP